MTSSRKKKSRDAGTPATTASVRELPAGPPAVVRVPNALLLTWNVERVGYDPAATASTGAREAPGAKPHAPTAERLDVRLAAPGVQVTLAADEGARYRGEKHAERLRAAVREARGGNERELVTFLKTFPAFSSHPQVVAACEALTPQCERLARLLRREPSRGRRVEAGPEYAEVLAEQRAVPGSSFEAAIRRVYARTAGARRGEAHFEGFRRKVYQQKDRCEPYAVPAELHLD